MNRLTAMFLALATVANVQADTNIELELEALAKDVVAILHKQNQTSIRIGKFNADGDIPTNFGPEFQRILGAKFAASKIEVNKNALIEIQGNYGAATVDPDEPNLNQMYTRVVARLVDTKTRVALASLGRAIHGNDALREAFPITVDLTPNGDRQTRNDQIRKGIEKPNAFIQGTQVRSSKESPFAVEILVVDDPKASDPADGAPITIKDELPFVKITKGQSYKVKIHNNADFDAAIQLRIDGLDQYVFSDQEFRKPDGQPKFEHFIIRKKSSYVISGWFRSLKTLDAFTVDDYAKSAAAELKASQEEIGTISVAFHAAWNTPEELNSESGKDARDPNATRRGATIDTNLIQIKKFVGVCRNQVTVRYTTK